MSNTFTIYRSSAGSGKTRTLAKEYLKLAMRSRAQYFKHILAVTFTNKATQEMKDRILAYLDEFANGKHGDLADELKSELRLDASTFQQHAQEVQAAILHEYSHFAISTIDAFFQKVIRSFTREAGLTGDYRLEIDQDTVLEEVIAGLIDELGNNKELTDWVVDFARENLENERPWDIRTSLLEFSREIFREEFKAIEDEVMAVTSREGYFQDLKKRLIEIRSRFLGQLNRSGAEAIGNLEKRSWDMSEISYGKNAGLFSFLHNFATVRRVKDLKDVSDRIRAFAADAKNWPGKRTAHARIIMETAETVVPMMQRMLSVYDQGITEALSAEVALQNLYVFGLVTDITRKLREFKVENNVMLLADAPRFLNGVIQDSDTPFVYEKVGSFYRNYLIDEFQDTSGLQWKNFLPLLLNSLDQGYPSLVVGDVKQAIYRWRGGDLNLLHEHVEHHIGGERVSIHNLDSNYRSARSIVDFNNGFFSSSSAIVAAEMNHALPQAAYRDIAQRISRTDQGYTEVRFIRDEEDGRRWKDIALQNIPLYLEELQAKGVSLSEIAIIVRKNEEGQDIVNYLLQYKVSHEAKSGYRYDVVSGESLRIDTAATVSLLEGAMKYLLNPDDALARAQLAFEFARIFDAERPTTEVFSVSNQAVFESYLPAAFTQHKARLKKMPLIELTETLIGVFKLGQHKGELPYLQAFQNLVLDFFTRERNDLGAFLEWWENNKTKKSIPVSGQVDAAQIITIHKSKGLQFRHVLMPFCSWAVDHDNFMAPQLWVKTDVQGFKYIGYLPVRYSSLLVKTYFHEAYHQERIRTGLDNLNLLYVALTRAETSLTVYAPSPDNKKGKKNVGGLLYDGIVSSPMLEPLLEKNTAIFRMGVAEFSSGTSKMSNGHTVELEHYPADSWRDKLVIRQRAKDFFEKNDPARRERINYGIHLHHVLSRITTTVEIQPVLESLHDLGSVSRDELSLLQDQIASLMNNPQIRDWFSDKWEVRTEVSILLPEGKESRIDRLMIMDRRVVLVDFKTGDPVKSDQKQVMEYIEILRKMNYADVEGYLLYVRTGEIIAVSPSRSRVSKRKNDNQLDLGL